MKGIRTSVLRTTRSDKTSKFAGSVMVSRDLNVGRNLSASADFKIFGNLTFGDASTDTLSVTGLQTNLDDLRISNDGALKFREFDTGMSSESAGNLLISTDTALTIKTGTVTIADSANAYSLNIKPSGGFLIDLGNAEGLSGDIRLGKRGAGTGSSQPVIMVISAISTGSPTGTGAGFANRGSICTDLLTGELYVNRGTRVAPSWDRLLTG